MADYYWVGATGNWSDLTKWRVGGVQPGSLPTSADNVFFDAASDAGANFTVTVNTAAICANFDARSLDFTMTLAGSSSLTVHGDFYIASSNTNRTYTGTLTFASTSTGKTIQSGGSWGATAIVFNGVGGGWTLQDSLIITSSLSVTNGTFDTGNNTVSCSSIVSTGTGTRTISLGSSTVTISGSSPFNWSTSANFTFNAGTSTINISNAGPNFDPGAARTFYNVTFTSSAATSITLVQTNTFNNLTFTSLASAGYISIILNAGFTVNGTLDFGNASAGNKRYLVRSNTLATQRVITLNGSMGNFSDIDFRDINFTGTAALPVSGTRIGNGGGNGSNITFSTTRTVYWNLSGSQNWNANAWSDSSTGSPDPQWFPLPQDTATFTDSGSAGTVTVNTGYNIGNLDFSGRTSAVTFAGTTAFTSVGNITLGSGVTWSNSATVTMYGTYQTQYVTGAGKTISSAITQNNSSTVSLTDNVTLSNTLTYTLTTGNLVVGNNTLSTGIFASNVTSTRAIDFSTSGKISLTSPTTGTQWNLTTLSGFSVSGTGGVELAGSPNASVTRTVLHGSSSGGTESNSVNVTVAAAGTSTTYALTGVFKNITFNSGVTCTLSNTIRTVYGNLTLTSAVTATSGANATTFAATSGTQQVTTAGVTLDFPITVNCPGATVELQDNLTSGTTRTTTHTAGTVDLKDLIWSTGVWSSSNSNTRVVAFRTSGKIYVTSTGTVWNCGTITNWSYTGTDLVNVTDASATSKTIIHGPTGGGSSNALTLVLNGSGQIILAGVYNQPDFTNFTGSLGGTYNIYWYDNLSLGSSMTTVSSSFIWYFYNSSGTQTFTTNGVTINCLISFGTSTSTATFQLLDDLTMAAGKSITLVGGTLDLNDNKIFTSIFLSNNSNTRHLGWGNAGLIELNGDTTVTAWNTSTVVNLTLSGSRDVKLTGATPAGQKITLTNGTSQGSKDIAFNINVAVGGGNVIAEGCFQDFVIQPEFTGTLDNVVKYIFGNLALSTNQVIQSGNNALYFYGNDIPHTIQTSAQTIPFDVIFTGGNTSDYTLLDDFTLTGNKRTTFTWSNVHLNDHTITTQYVTGHASNPIILDFDTTGSIVLNPSTSNTTEWSWATAGNLVVQGTSNVWIDATCSNVTITHGTPSRTVLVTGQSNKAINLTVASNTRILTRCVLNNLVFLPVFNNELIGPGNQYLECLGNLIFESGATISSQGNLPSIVFRGDNTVQHLQTNGNNLNTYMYLTSATTTLTLDDDLTSLYPSSFSFYAGNLNLNGHRLTSSAFYDNGNPGPFYSRVIDTSAGGNITINGAGNEFSQWQIANVAGLITNNVTVYITDNVQVQHYYNNTVDLINSEKNWINLYINAGSNTKSVDLDGWINDITFDTDYQGKWYFNFGELWINGNLVLSDSMATDGIYSKTITFIGQDRTQIIDCKSKELVIDTVVFSGNATYQLASDLNISSSAAALSLSEGTCELKSGNLNINNKTLYVGYFDSTMISDLPRSIQNNGNIVINQPGYSWQVSGNNFTMSSTGTIEIVTETPSEYYFQGNNLTYPKLIAGGNGNLFIYDSNTFNGFENKPGALTVWLPTYETTTIAGNLKISSNSSNIIALSSDTSDVRANIHCTGTVCTADYTRFKDLAVTGKPIKGLTANGCIEDTNTIGIIYAKNSQMNM